MTKLPPRHLAVPIALACVGLALHVLTSSRYGYFRDELYYIACSRHLAMGYVDHPPMIAWLIFLVGKTIGLSLPALRLLPALAIAALIVVTSLLARQLGGGRFAQGVAALSALIAPVFLAAGTTFTMNPIDQLLWTLTCYFLVRALAEERGRLWVCAGLTAGLGLLTKQSTAFYLAATFAALLLTPQRRALRTRWPWIAAALAAFIAHPNWIWEVHNGWPTLEFLHNATAHKNAPVTPGDFIAQQILMISPANSLMVMLGLFFLLFSPRGARWRAFGFAFVFLLAYFVLAQAKNYYFAPAYPLMFAAGAVAAGEWMSNGPQRLLKPVLVAFLLAIAWVPVPIVVPVLPVEDFIRYEHRLGFKPGSSERHTMRSLPQDYADMFGWEEMVAKIARVYHSLPPAEQARCAIYAHNYGEAGAIDFFGPRYGLPRAASGHNSYYLWGPPPGRGLVVITIGEDSSDVAKTYRQVTPADTTSSPYSMAFEDGNPIYIGRVPINTFAEIWRRCKLFI